MQTRELASLSHSQRGIYQLQSNPRVIFLHYPFHSLGSQLLACVSHHLRSTSLALTSKLRAQKSLLGVSNGGFKGVTIENFQRCTFLPFIYLSANAWFFCQKWMCVDIQAHREQDIRPFVKKPTSKNNFISQTLTFLGQYIEVSGKKEKF